MCPVLELIKYGYIWNQRSHTFRLNMRWTPYGMNDRDGIIKVRLTYLVIDLKQLIGLYQIELIIKQSVYRQHCIAIRIWNMFNCIA